MNKIITVRELLLEKQDIELYYHLKTVMLILKYKGLTKSDLHIYLREALDTPVSELEAVDMKWMDR